MKYIRFFILLSIILATTNFAVAQQKKTYSNEELTTICKGWGLLKYYHPIISQGRVNWDSVLISALKSENKIPVSRLMQNWLTAANKIQDTSKAQIISSKCDSIDRRNFNVQWISQSTLLTPQIKAEFNKMIKAGTKGTFYSKSNLERYSGANEKRYAANTAEYRLLSLFRFWNVIAYFYPYKYGINWDNTLKLFIPHALKADTPEAYARFLTALAATLKDAHSSVTPEEQYVFFGKLGAPFHFKIIEGQAVVTKIIDAALCKKAAIEIGDAINKVDGHAIQEIIRANAKYISGSNASVVMRETYQFLFTGNNPTFIASGTRKNGHAFTQQVERIKRNFNEWDRTGQPANPFAYYDEIAKKVVYTKKLTNDILYIDRSSIANADADTIIAQMRNTKGVIFDMRWYEDKNALAMIKIFNFLSPKPAPYAIKTTPDFYHPGQFCYEGWVNGDLKTVGGGSAGHYKGKVMVLINEETQSAEEFFAMMFKTIPNVTFIGSQTAGADGNMTNIPLADAHTIVMSGIGIFYPNGQETQRVGIKPDVVVKPTIKDIRAGKDALLDKALALIK